MVIGILSVCRLLKTGAWASPLELLIPPDEGGVLFIAEFSEAVM